MAKKILSFQNGDIIIKAGDKQRRMFIILDGKVEITIDDGMKTVTLATFEKNDFFGEISLLNNTARSANAVAVGRTKLTYIDSMKSLEKLMLKNPIYTRKMVRELTRRLAQTDEILKRELGGNSKAKLVNFMW